MSAYIDTSGININTPVPYVNNSSQPIRDNWAAIAAKITALDANFGLVYDLVQNIPRGYSGISGFSGINGSAIYSGYSGYSGFSGFSGLSGYSGYSGISGYSGYSGFSGFSGFNGLTGVNGNNGLSGYSGYSGAPPANINVQFSNDNNTYYPVFVNGTGSQPVYIQTSNLYYNPNTSNLYLNGTLSFDNLNNCAIAWPNGVAIYEDASGNGPGDLVIRTYDGTNYHWTVFYNNGIFGIPQSIVFPDGTHQYTSGGFSYMAIVTGSRSLGATYTNSYGRPMFLCVTVGTGGVFNNGNIYLNGNYTGSWNVYGVEPEEITIMVPAGYTYSVTVSAGSASIIQWVEIY